MVVHLAAYREGRRLPAFPLEQISDVVAESGSFVWMGLREPDAKLLEAIQNEFQLHELAIEDARSAHQRPKLEEFGHSLFLVLRTAQWVHGALRFGETHIFVGRQFLITVRHGSSLSFAKVRERCEAQPALLAMGPGFALYALLDFVVDNYMPAVEALRDRLDAVEESIFRGRFDNSQLEVLYELKRELLALRGAVAPVQDICAQLMRFHGDLVPEGIHFYFRDIEDHARRIDHTLDSMREMLTAALQVHLAMITVRQNEIVKRLAGWAGILALPTMIFSLYGMNFKVMPELDWQYGYPATLAVAGIVCAWLYRRLKRAGWL